jgi:ABC-type transporter MlaC component
MKRIISSATVLAVALIASASAQAPASKEDQAVTALVKEVQAQQARIAENQAKIDTKLVELTEAIRVARIFAGRSGK